jgi:hypothetical protein
MERLLTDICGGFKAPARAPRNGPVQDDRQAVDEETPEGDVAAIKFLR